MPGDFVGDHEDDLKAIACAIADQRPSEVAGSAAALLVKLLTGSSILAGSAEKIAARSFGKWLADNPDARLEQAAQAFAASDRKRADLQAFAERIKPVLFSALRSVERSLAELGQGQHRTHEQLNDLEALLGQALRATALVQVGQEDLKSMLARLHGLLAALEKRPSVDGHKAAPAPAALAVWREKLAFLEAEEAKLVDPEQKFRMRKLIEEAMLKIREHEQRG
jgi:hypothetical protein